MARPCSRATAMMQWLTTGAMIMASGGPSSWCGGSSEECESNGVLRHQEVLTAVCEMAMDGGHWWWPLVVNVVAVSVAGGKPSHDVCIVCFAGRPYQTGLRRAREPGYILTQAYCG